MHELVFTSLVFGASVVAGLLGAMTGLGGGVVIVPALTLLFQVDIRYAIGASLVSVIATSSGSAVAYMREGLSNIRIGMFLEVATTLGALVGAYLTAKVSSHWIAMVFGAVLLYSAVASFIDRGEGASLAPAGALAVRLKLRGVYPGTTERNRTGADATGMAAAGMDAAAGQPYSAQRIPLGFGIMFGAGALSGLLGIGSGAVKVLAMDQAMRLPFKVSTTTSNFMIGVTAAASAGIYLARGYIEPGLAMPVMLGVLAGSVLGTRVLVRVRPSALKILFAVVILALGCEMIFNGVTG